MTYTTNSLEQLELFSETDMESVQIDSNELENLESVLGENLESLSSERVAEDVEKYMEEHIESRSAIRSGHRQLAQIAAYLSNKAVKKILDNPNTRRKLEAACRKGPGSVCQLIKPLILQPFSEFGKGLINPYCSPTIARMYSAISTEVGLKTEEIEAAPEFAISLSTAAAVVSAGAAVGSLFK